MRRFAIAVLCVASLSALDTARGAGPPYVAQALFTRAVRSHRPVDNITSVLAGTNPVNYFVDVRNLDGGAVVIRWSYRGRVLFARRFAIGGPRWRIDTRVLPRPGQTGLWVATVTGPHGLVLAVNSLLVLPSASPPAKVHEQQR